MDTTKKMGRLVLNGGKWMVTYTGAGRVKTTMEVVEDQQEIIKEESAKEPVEFVVEGSRVRVKAYVLGGTLPPPSDDLSLLSDDFGQEK